LPHAILLLWLLQRVTLVKVFHPLDMKQWRETGASGIPVAAGDLGGEIPDRPCVGDGPAA
jgi:hypothetical protein